MPRRAAMSSILMIVAGSALLAARGRADAQPAQMEEAARGCGIRTFAVAPSNATGQTPYALYFDSAEQGIDGKLGCYQARLEAMGVERTLGLGSAGFDPGSDMGLLFARVGGACGLPESALAMIGEAEIPTIFGRGLAPSAIDCAAGELRKTGRFARIDIRSNEVAPPAPTFDPAFPGNQN